jgi:hypothetical protein
VLSLLLAALLSAPPAPAPAPVQVTSAKAEIIVATRLDDPPGMKSRTFLLIRADGKVGGVGWSNVRLVELGEETSRGIGPSADGYLEFKLVADPPEGAGSPAAVIEHVSAAKFGEITVVPGKLKGVRVRGRDTVVDARIEGLAAAEREAQGTARESKPASDDQYRIPMRSGSIIPKEITP